MTPDSIYGLESSTTARTNDTQNGGITNLFQSENWISFVMGVIFWFGIVICFSASCRKLLKSLICDLPKNVCNDCFIRCVEIVGCCCSDSESDVSEDEDEIDSDQLRPTPLVHFTGDDIIYLSNTIRIRVVNDLALQDENLSSSDDDPPDYQTAIGMPVPGENGDSYRTENEIDSRISLIGGSAGVHYSRPGGNVNLTFGSRDGLPCYDRLVSESEEPPPPAYSEVIQESDSCENNENTTT